MPKSTKIELSSEGIDVTSIVKHLLNPDPPGFDLTEIPECSIYAIGDIAVNFQRKGDSVIMRLVEKQC